MIQLTDTTRRFSAVHNGLKFQPRTFWADHSENPSIRTDRMKLYPRKCDTALSQDDLFKVKVIPDDPDSRDAMKMIMVDVLCGGSGDGQAAVRCVNLSMHPAAVDKAHKILKALGWRAQKDHP